MAIREDEPVRRNDHTRAAASALRTVWSRRGIDAHNSGTDLVHNIHYRLRVGIQQHCIRIAHCDARCGAMHFSLLVEDKSQAVVKHEGSGRLGDEAHLESRHAIAVFLDLDLVPLVYSTRYRLTLSSSQSMPRPGPRAVASPFFKLRRSVKTGPAMSRYSRKCAV